MVDLTVCVIGRNEARNIERCATSLRALKGVRLETIYVDSASVDGSAEVAACFFDVVLVLEVSPHLNASAARHVGTREARGQWILYLDADMALAPEIVEEICALIASGDTSIGLSGRTINVFPDGSTSLMRIKGNRDKRRAIGFGGAVLLPRGAVLSAGNWDPGLYSNEEMELYSRVKGHCTVMWCERTLAYHHTAKIAKLLMLRSIFLPQGSILGKKFFGAGQAVAASLLRGTLTRFIATKPQPFVYIALLFLSGLVAVSGLRGLAAILGIVAISYAAVVGGVRAPITYLSWLPQLALGLSRYSREYEPRVFDRRIKK